MGIEDIQNKFYEDCQKLCKLAQEKRKFYYKPFCDLSDEESSINKEFLQNIWAINVLNGNTVEFEMVTGQKFRM